MVAKYGYMVNKRLVLGLALTAVLGAMLLVTLLPTWAQNTDDPIEFAEIPDGTEDPDLEVADFTAVDPEGSAAKWNALGGADSGAFNFKDGVLSFKDAPNFEDPTDAESTDPADAAGNNTYVVTLMASDGTIDGNKEVMVKVINVEEEATTGIDLSVVQPREGDFVDVVYKDKVGNPYLTTNDAGAAVAHAGIVDPDGHKGADGPAISDPEMAIPAADVTWQWARGNSRTGPFTDITKADNPTSDADMFEPEDADRGKFLRVTGTYEDKEGENKTVMAISQYEVLAFRSDDKSPAFPEDFSTDEGIQAGPSAEVGDGTTNEAAVGARVIASGESGERLTYSLAPDTTGHADLFQINRSTGQVTVGIGKTVNPANDANENVDDPKAAVFTVTINVSDGLPSEDHDNDAATDDITHSDTAVMTITVKPVVDENPVFEKGETSHKHAEDKKVPAGDATLTEGDPDPRVYTFAAYDPETTGAGLTYKLSGADADKFVAPPATPVNNTADDTQDFVLTFKAQPNYEEPGDDNKDNIYEVTLRASATSTSADADAKEKSTSINVTVEVTNAQDPGSLSLSAREPRVGVPISTMSLSDDDGAVSGVTWQWQVVSQVDSPNTGVGDCVFENLAKDSDDATKVLWVAAKGDGARTDTYTPESDDDGKCLRATASYTDPAGPTSASEVSENVVEKARNLAPKFNDEDDIAKGIQIEPRFVTEGADVTEKVVSNKDGSTDDTGSTPNTDLVLATDTDDAETADDDVIDYNLSGADAKYFTIDSAGDDSRTAADGTTQVPALSGQIRVSAAGAKELNYEKRRTYRVTVTAVDLEGLNSSVSVTINVVNENEGPEIMQGTLAVSGAPLVEYDSTDSGDVGTYTAVGRDAAGASWSLSGDDDGDFNISQNGVVTFRNPPDSANPSDADMDNVYEFTVVATSGGKMAEKDVTVTVDSAAAAGPRTSLDQYTNQERFDLNGDGIVSDVEVRQVIRAYFTDNPGN